MTTPFRADHFDPRDPSAPAVFMCTGCDAMRDAEVAFCESCEDVTGSYVGPGIAGTGIASTRPVAEMGFRRDEHGMITLDEELAA